MKDYYYIKIYFENSNIANDIIDLCISSDTFYKFITLCIKSNITVLNKKNKLKDYNIIIKECINKKADITDYNDLIELNTIIELSNELDDNYIAVYCN